VGKSVIFNQLTGLSQVVGNWPGKTVKKAEGIARFKDYIFHIVDLPGIYSLSAYSIEEIVSREYIIDEIPDYIINIIDSNHLERNLFFTLQLMMLNVPLIVCLNQYDILAKRGYDIDAEQLSQILGVPVVKTIAVHNRGVHELLENIIEVYENKKTVLKKSFPMGKEIETYMAELMAMFTKDSDFRKCPIRFASIKLLENDEKCINSLHLDRENGRELLVKAATIRASLEDLHGEQISTIINTEFYKIANDFTQKVLSVKKLSRKQKWAEIIDHLTVHSLWGYLILIVVLLGTYLVIFQFGNWFSGLLYGLFEHWSPGAAAALGGAESTLYKVVWNGLFGGLIGGVGGVLPFVLPFFLIIEILQDIGYLPRAAYLMDHFMHRIGVHGKTIIPIILGFGCNVPAVTASAILDTQRERKRSILISSMIPCSAVTTIVLGLVAKFLGIGYALLLYVVNLGVIVLIGKIMTMFDKFAKSELIIELHDFRVPNFKVILKQTWHRSKDFILIAMPLIIVLGAIMQILIEFNILEVISSVISPITAFIGLPVGVGAFLIYGIFRKELNLVLLENYVVFTLGLSLTTYLSPIQMIVFTVVVMLYVPCLATLITITKEVGWKFMSLVFVIQITVAVAIGGLMYWLFRFASIFSGISEQVALILMFLLFFIILIIPIIIMNIRKTKLKKKTTIGKEYLELESCSRSCENCNICEDKEN
jgi:ferrous iron transport protein B